MRREKPREIAIKGVPDGYHLQVVMLMAPTQAVTVSDPQAEVSAQCIKSSTRPGRRLTRSARALGR